MFYLIGMRRGERNRNREILEIEIHRRKSLKLGPLCEVGRLYREVSVASSLVPCAPTTEAEFNLEQGLKRKCVVCVGVWGYNPRENIFVRQTSITERGRSQERCAADGMSLQRDCHSISQI